MVVVFVVVAAAAAEAGNDGVNKHISTYLHTNSRLVGTRREWEQASSKHQKHGSRRRVAMATLQ